MKKVRIRKCKYCNNYHPVSNFKDTPFKSKNGRYAIRKGFKCSNCKGEKVKEHALGTLVNYHNKMNSENFQRAEQYRRKERYYRDLKEKYLELFYQEQELK